MSQTKAVLLTVVIVLALAGMMVAGALITIGGELLMTWMVLGAIGAIVVFLFASIIYESLRGF